MFYQHHESESEYQPKDEYPEPVGAQCNHKQMVLYYAVEQ